MINRDMLFRKNAIFELNSTLYVNTQIAQLHNVQRTECRAGLN